ncbi:amino acid adenylation domain-containing protein [Lysobacter sp. GCM10012299]|uniref:amino acid adenylation domain-containing protein n=1 Tax=Lysobacter sp. GCM10012299 TaxID=3317333 RepID=UPI0036235A35
MCRPTAHGELTGNELPALVEVPADRPRGREASAERAMAQLLVPDSLRTALQVAADDQGQSLATAVLAGWATLLHRLSNQAQLAIAVEGRSGATVLPVRLDLDATIIFPALIAKAGEQLALATTAATEGVSTDGWQIGFAVGDGTAVVTELSLRMRDSGGVLTLELEGDAALYEAATLQRYLRYGRNLLVAATAAPEQAIGRLAMIDAVERAHLLDGWNDTHVAYPQDCSLHSLIEAQVQRTPDAPAVVAEDRTLSYVQLNREANRLAHHLRAQGVRPDDRVGICIERGWAMVVGLLAILKSGGAYVPLDPSYPQDRLVHMLGDSAPKVLLTQAKLLPLLQSLEVRCPVLDLSVSQPAWAGEADTDVGAEALGLDARHLAYMIYTSGSTGLPKGAMNEHRGIVNRLLWMQDEYGLDANDTVLQKTPFSFDVSVWEFFWPLLTGARLVMARPDGHKDPAYLASVIREHGVTTMHFVPSMLHAFLEDDASPGCAGVLKRVMCSGEALPVALAERFHQRLPGVELHNLYGPTEAAVDVTAWTSAPGKAALSIPIGRPIANTRMYVLDPHLEPVPQGVTGELYIAGVQVGRGYLNRDELTAERFLPDPFAANDPQARMYRTGDLGRWLPDGNIEYQGRNDFQVKIRGFRIELGEIEARLTEHPLVTAGVVLARPDGDGDLRLVAYYVTQPVDAALGVEALRAHLGQQLPDHMIPAHFIHLPALPVTPNGKLDRRALPEPGSERPELAVAFEPAQGAVEQMICAAYAAVLGIEQIGRHDNFFDLGGNSLLAMRLLERVRRERDAAAGEGATLSALDFFRHPTPAGLAALLQGGAQSAIPESRFGRGPRDGAARNEAVAIVAMAGRFPGADDVEAFWRNLCEGRDTITYFKPDELDPAVTAAERNDPGYVAARGIIEGLENFDAAFFGISPREAELMDPQQRIFLELSWECLERAGYAPDSTPGPVGVFAGMNNGTYFQRHLAHRPDLIAKLGDFQVMVNNEKDYIATHVAHKLNLTGPAVSTHTACSTSLVAICQAVDSLRAGQCDMALAGAASATCPPRSGYRHIEGAMLSRDGHTRTFDRDATGTVFSDGATVVLLKRLSDALADGDPVYAVIRGAAINNDGGHKASFTAPSSEGQAAVIAMAQADAGVDPRSISYVEAHGTATPLGDPIEVEGLTRAFRRSTQDTGFCRIGSVKSNVGHLVIAAGGAGVIKTALSLWEQRIPASLHFQQANASIDFAATPFIVNDRLSDWPAGDVPRRAGVSSFGVGGTNAHVVMEEAPARDESDLAQGPQLLVLSARTPAALARSAERLAEQLGAAPQANLADVAWTLAVGRKAFAHRVCVVATDAAAAAESLRTTELNAAAMRSRPARSSEVVFMFPGQGSQYAGMGRGLYESEAAFRAAFDECAELLRGELGFDLRERVFHGDAQDLQPTAVMQPATFAIEYSLARTWMSHGVMPAAMIGHSVGEFVAATLAGVFTLADALRLVARRGALMQAQPTGTMMSVRMALDALLARLPADLSLAAENSPGACVVSGPDEAIARFQAALEGDGVACRVLHTSHAFHSAMMDPVVAPFHAEAAAVTRNAPAVPLMSTATAQWLDAETAMSADYWASHLREPVRFAAALERMVDERPRVLLEVGPRTTLATLARQHPGVQRQPAVAVSSLADSPEAEDACLRNAAGQLWCRGVAIDPATFDRRQRRRRVLLPTYPFERQRFWVDAPSALANVVPHPALNINVPMDLEIPMPHLVASPTSADAGSPAQVAVADRRPVLIGRLRDVFEDVVGFDLSDADSEANFMELGLDSLMLTQVATQLQKTFAVSVTFRQLMGEFSSLDRLAKMLDEKLPAEAPPAPAAAPAPVAQAAVAQLAVAPVATVAAPVAAMAMPAASLVGAAQGDFARALIAQQMQLMQQQLALLAGAPVAAVAPAAVVAAPVAPPVAAAPAAVAAAVAPTVPAAPAAPADAAADPEAAALAHTKYDVQKAFGAIARIHNARQDFNDHQRKRLAEFTQRYLARSPKSKAYTQEHRSHMADPRVVNGFRPALKEIIYQIVIGRSKGSHLFDIDGNEYIDATNGFGMSMFGWQPDFVLDAIREQLDLGYEIGPQHPLSGEVAKLICDFTGHDRAALCNTGSEAVLGAIRIARTITGRSTIVSFNGSYHGINDEVIVRGTKKLRAVPAAPGILANTAENILVLDYGTPESLEIIRSRAHELAAVLVEPVQSRRPDFQPVEFLREVRKITEEAGAALIFDEVITGFRSHPAGAQALFGIKADLATYGKVIGGGYPLGVVAGKREFMDALDGGHWQYGDDSVPTVGVTYFAGTFVRHPLALAAAKAVLEHMKEVGPQLQEQLTARTTAYVNELNAFLEEVGAPISIKQFASLWRTQFLEDHPMQELLFAMLRSRGVHIVDNFPCFLTTAHSEADVQAMLKAYKESILELVEAQLLPGRLGPPPVVMDPSRPPVPGARLGREPDGRPAWFVPNESEPGKYRKVGA